MFTLSPGRVIFPLIASVVLGSGNDFSRAVVMPQMTGRMVDRRKTIVRPLVMRAGPLEMVVYG